MNPGTDPAFVIRGDLIQTFSCQMIGNFSKESNFLWYKNLLNF